MEKMQGQCYCGKVKYEVIRPLNFVVHDHCSICRRISGAPFVTWASAKEENFKVTAGEEDLSSFKSSPEALRQFCKHCGSHLFFRSGKHAGHVHFTVATLVTKNVDAPKFHVFFTDKADWIQVNDGLPKYGGVTGFEKL